MIYIPRDIGKKQRKASYGRVAPDSPDPKNREKHAPPMSPSFKLVAREKNEEEKFLEEEKPHKASPSEFKAHMAEEYR